MKALRTHTSASDFLLEWEILLRAAIPQSWDIRSESCEWMCFGSPRHGRPPLLHISHLVIGSQTVHYTDVLSGSRMSQYGSDVACMIISNPLCSGSGLAADPCWPPWNWFCAWTWSRRKWSRGAQEKSRGEKGKRRENRAVFEVYWKTVFGLRKDRWLQWLTLIEHL